MEVNQQKLHELEQLCVREQPPAAMASCPLHINCREICNAAAKGDFDEARAVYEKSAVFPEILSRVCEQLCGQKCIRRERGGALHLRALELAAITYGQQKKSRLFLPKKQEQIAVIGAGLSGLSAAVELGKKGYRITVFERRETIWGGLKADVRISPEILHQAGERLKQYQIEIRTGTEIKEMPKAFDAVVAAWGVTDQPLVTDPFSFQVSQEALFAVGDARRERTGTYVEAIAEGKRAATSVERYLKKVSMEAGREKEGVYETTLYVRWDQEPNRPPRTDEEQILTKEEAMEEADRCLDCKCTECTDACAFMRHYKSYPKKYLREIYNNLSIAMGTRHANKMINSCTLCGQCASVCPYGLDLGETIREARQMMVEKGKMPQSAFEFALNDMVYSNSEAVFLSRTAPGSKGSAYAFFPGCQLTAAAPAAVEACYEDLRKRFDQNVGLVLGCCGIMADWAGEQKRYQQTLSQLRKAWEDQGKPVMILACPTCYDVWMRDLSEIPCVGIWDVLLEQGLPEGYESYEGRMVIHDSCGARKYPKIRERVRMLAEQMGMKVKEETYRKEQSLCCGYGGLAPVSNPQVADEITDQWKKEDEGMRLTYCINCRDRMVKGGGEAVHILELLYDTRDAKDRQAPGYSLRRENRYRLRQKLLTDVWKETVKEEEQMKLSYSKEMGELLERRKILKSDIRHVLSWSEQGHRIRDSRNGTYIGHRQVGNVTYWISYRVAPNGEYVIENAYCHRMTISKEGQEDVYGGKIL